MANKFGVPLRETDWPSLLNTIYGKVCDAMLVCFDWVCAMTFLMFVKVCGKSSELSWAHLGTDESKDSLIDFKGRLQR